MALRNSPDRSNNVSTPTAGLSMKLVQAAAALSMLTASTAASAAETVKKVTAECADGQHLDYTVKDGVFEGKCVDDEEGDKKTVKKHVAKPKPVAVCKEGGQPNVVEFLPEEVTAITNISATERKVGKDTEKEEFGTFEILEGQAVVVRVNCVDTLKNKADKPVDDQARLLQLAKESVRITIDDTVFTPSSVKLHGGGEILIMVPFRNPGKHIMVTQTLTPGGTREEKKLIVKADPAKKAQKEAIAKAQKDADDAKKMAEDARNKTQQAPAPVPAPVPQPAPAPIPAPAPKKQKEADDTDKYTSYGTAGVSYVSVLGRPSSMASVGASWMDQRAQYTAVGGGVDIGFEQNRETIVQGKETQGGSSTHIFPSVQVALGAQHNGLLGLAKAGPDIEIGNKLVLDNGVTHSGDSGTSFRAELGLGYTVELTKKFGLRLMAVGDVMAGGLDKLGRDDAATRWNAGATISFIGHNESDDQEDTNE